MKIYAEMPIQDQIKLFDQWCQNNFIGHKTLYVPAGNTPIIFYEYWMNSNPDYLKDIQFVQIDDVITGMQSGLFKNFFETHLPALKSQFHWINDGFIQADLAFLGIGLNGHLAFHEPHLPIDFKYGEVTLSDKSTQTLNLAKNEKGLTYGLASFLNTKSIIVVANGESKREVIRSFINKDPRLPCSQLWNHPDVTFLTDQKLT